MRSLTGTTTPIDSLTFLPAADRDWMLARAGDLRRQYADRPDGAGTCLVHGDPWSGKFVRAHGGPVLLDLERFSIGPPEYDLTVIAAGYTSYGLLPEPAYRDLVAADGRDVTTWPGYPLLRDIRELRVTTYAGQVALDHPAATGQACTDCAACRAYTDRAPGPDGTPSPDQGRRPFA